MQLALSSASSDLQRNLGFSMKPKKGINQSASFPNIHGTTQKVRLKMASVADVPW